MNPYIKTLNAAQMEGKTIPEFRTGDTLAVQLRVRDMVGESSKKTSRERLQPFIGVVLARKNKGLNSSVTLHRVVDGESISLVVPLYSPLVASVEVKRRGDVRRAKIYYLSELRGKAARIKERHIKKEKIVAFNETESVPVADLVEETQDNTDIESQTEVEVTEKATEE